MAVNKENLSPRTPLPDGPSKVASEKIAAPTPPVFKQSQNPGEEIQVPSTAPPPTEDAPINKPEEVHAQDPAEDENLDDEDEASDTELPLFDWIDLRKRYTKAFQEINENEDRLLEEFDEFSDVLIHLSY